MRGGTYVWDDLGVDELLLYVAHELHNKVINSGHLLSH